MSRACGHTGPWPTPLRSTPPPGAPRSSWTTTASTSGTHSSWSSVAWRSRRSRTITCEPWRSSSRSTSACPSSCAARSLSGGPRWASPPVLYTGNKVFSRLVSIPYYYYWDVPLAFAVLGALLVSSARPRVARRARHRRGRPRFRVWVRASVADRGLALRAAPGDSFPAQEGPSGDRATCRHRGAPGVPVDPGARSPRTVDACNMARGGGRPRVLSEPVRPPAEGRVRVPADPREVRDRLPNGGLRCARPGGEEGVPGHPAEDPGS